MSPTSIFIVTNVINNDLSLDIKSIIRVLSAIHSLTPVGSSSPLSPKHLVPSPVFTPSTSGVNPSGSVLPESVQHQE